MTTTTPDTDYIIQKNVIWPTPPVPFPIPLLKIESVTAVNIDMLKEICQAYELPYSSVRGKALISAISGSIMARYWASLLKAAPGFGTILGSVSMSIMSGATTFALGKVFDKYLCEKGSLENIDKEEAKKMFRKEFRKGRRYARILKAEEHDVYEQLEKLGALKEKGILTEEEFEEKKKSLLDRIG